MFDESLTMQHTQKLKILQFQNFKTSLKIVKSFVYFVSIDQDNSNKKKLLLLIIIY